jgi:hypothetical protein
MNVFVALDRGSGTYDVCDDEPARMSERLEGASNEKAKGELGWQPRYPSFRRGFREALG